MPDTASAPLTLLTITEKQRDSLAAALHNSERSRFMQDQIVADLSRQLAAAQARIAELEKGAGTDDDLANPPLMKVVGSAPIGDVGQA